MAKRTIINPITKEMQDVMEFIEYLCGRKLFLFEKVLLNYQFKKEGISTDINNPDYDMMYVISKGWGKCKI